MKSPNTIRARVIAKILLLVAGVFGFGTAVHAKPANPAVKPEATSKAVAGACILSVTPLAHISPGAGDTFDVQVTVLGPGCTWTAGSNDNWISFTNFSGGKLTVKVLPNIGGPRGGIVTIRGWYQSDPNGSLSPTGVVYSVNVTQAAINCSTSWSFDSTSKSHGSGGEIWSFWAKTPYPSCSRNATSNANWLTITSGNDGVGSGRISYSVAANPGPARIGKITLANATFTVNQASGCSTTISPASAQIPAAGGGGSVTVSISSTSCSSFVQSLVPWIKASQVVNGKVNYTVDPNPGPQRDGIISIAGKSFQITQVGGCSYTLSFSTANFFANGGSGGLVVTASWSSCAWSPVSSASWVKINSAAQVTGNGAVNFTVDSNSGAARAATITVGNKTATINQAGAANCSFTISPGSQNFGASGGEVNVNVTASSAACSWIAGNASPFISVVSGASGAGNGVTKIKVQPNNGAARSGSAQVAGQTFNVTQDGVSAQAITITDLSPGFTAKGGGAFLLLVKGSNFTSACRVRWNGQERQTTLYNSSTLGAAISANDIASEGVFNVMVNNLNNGDDSNTKQFMAYGAVANVSSASFKGDSLAPNSLVSAFGVDLATQLKSADSQPLPTELADSTVTITDSEGKEHKAQLFFVSPGQINYLTPEDVAPGKATVMIKSGSGHISVGSVEIAQVAPGLFTANSSGQGVAAAVALRVKANGQQVYEQAAQYDAGAGAFIAKPIDLSVPGEQVYLIFYGTGLRYRNSLNAVSLQMGGVFGNVLYAGFSPGFAGIDQINALAPSSLAGRGEVDVVLTVNGKNANKVKLMFK